MSDYTPQDLEQLAAEYTKRAEAVAADVERMSEIKAILADHLTTGSHDLAGVAVQVRAGARRLDSKKLAEAHPFDRHPEFYSVQLDTAKAKEWLSPKQLEVFQSVGRPTVVFP